jgi:hypothetical protein
LIFYEEPFVKGDEIYIMFHNKLWFSRRKGENFNFLRTYKNPEVNSTSKLRPVRLNYATS